MYGIMWCDTLPNFLYPLFARPLLTWGVLGLMEFAAILLTYASLTRPMPRWWGILAWYALPLCIGLTMLYLVCFATRLLPGVS